ncbi:hypothetical protein J6590_039994 [Homalodisca vitripennis]|nr:hypothetical protein J6590_039994 [Homalodisca vitripennis]
MQHVLQAGALTGSTPSLDCNPPCTYRSVDFVIDGCLGLCGYAIEIQAGKWIGMCGIRRGGARERGHGTAAPIQRFSAAPTAAPHPVNLPVPALSILIVVVLGGWRPVAGRFSREERHSGGQGEIAQ